MGHLPENAALPVPIMLGMLEDAERPLSHTLLLPSPLWGNIQLPADWQTERTGDLLKTCEAPRRAESRSKSVPSIDHSDSGCWLGSESGGTERRD